MSNWKTEIKEISNNVYQLKMTHKLGSIIEKTGINLEAMKSEAIEDSMKLEKDIERKLK